MKYLDKKFNSPANNKAFVDNWDAIFGEKQEPEEPPAEEPTDPQSRQPPAEQR